MGQRKCYRAIKGKGSVWVVAAQVHGARGPAGHGYTVGRIPLFVLHNSICMRVVKMIWKAVAFD